MNWLKFADASALNEHLPPELMLNLLMHSISAGIVLMLANALAQWVVGDRYETESGVSSLSASERAIQHSPIGQVILTSANVLFLSMGMCGIMLLVSNNLARAFAIGAAIALIRFRIKISKSSLGMSLFFGVLVGMATGVQQVQVAYAIAFIFSFIQLLLVFLATNADRLAVALKSKKANPDAVLAPRRLQDLTIDRFSGQAIDHRLDGAFYPVTLKEKENATLEH